MSALVGYLLKNLRYCGIFDADTGFITGLTQFGVAEGFEIGNAIPTATDDLTGVYFVAQVQAVALLLCLAKPSTLATGASVMAPLQVGFVLTRSVVVAVVAVPAFK